MLHDDQKRVLRNAGRYNVVRTGRRWGKTTLGIALSAYGAPYAPGGLLKGYPVGWFAPTYKLLDEAWRSARAFMRARVVVANHQQHRLELDTGGALDFWTLEDPDAGRGRKYALVIIDEAAMARHLEQALTESIRPTLSDYRGPLWAFSTPKGRDYFHRMHLQAENGKRGWRSFHAPTSANPRIAQAEIDDARDMLPERVFRQEYEAEFIDAGGGVFRRVTDCVDPSLTIMLGRARGEDNALHRYVIGVDWGKHNDWTVFVVMDAATRSVIEFERFNKIDYTFQLQRLYALARRFPEPIVIAEANAMGEPLIDQARTQGLNIRGFTTTNATKAAIIEDLSLAFDEGTIAIPRIPVLIGELMAYDYERLPSGMLRYGAPADMHDDTVIALALAWTGVKSGMTAGYGVATR